MIANSGWQTEPGYVPPQDVSVDRGAGGVRQGWSLFIALLWSKGGEKWCQDESYQDCKTESIFAEMEKECKCIPLKLANFKKVS